jgi:DNA-binding transcriptional ArsR family regulator
VAKRKVQSTIDRLPEPIREEIGRLRRDGRTIDEIMAKLAELDVDVSRSAVGRHVKGLAEIGAQLRRSREIATALVGQFGAESDNRLARMNIELMHSVVMQTITAAAEAGEDGGEAQPVTFDAEEVMFLSRSLQALAGAEKTNADLTLKLKAEFARKAAEEVAKVGKAKGLSADTIAAIRHAVLGVS